MKITRIFTIVASFTGLSLTTSAYASIILGETVAARQFSITTIASDLVGNPLGYGSGINTGFKRIGGGPQTSFGLTLNTGLTNWSVSSTDAIAKKTFVDAVLTFNASAIYDLTALSYALKRGNNETATLTFALFTKINEGRFTDSGLSFTLLGSARTLTEKTLDLSNLTVLDNIGEGDILTFRLTVFSDTTNDASSTFAFGNITNLGTTTNAVSSAFILEGSRFIASPIPEPGTGALFCGVTVMTVVLCKRRRTNQIR